VETRYETELQFDIDGTKIIVLPYDPACKMKSSRDGRPWQTWVTSKRIGFDGVRRKAKCSGSYVCNNDNCNFLRTYKERNNVQFKKAICLTCGWEGEHVPCEEAVKVWEFGPTHVTVFHAGVHTCVARNRPEVPEDVREKLKAGATAGKAAEDVIIDEFLNSDDIDWEQIEKLTACVLDEEKVRNAKKKEKNVKEVNGHSFEAVGVFKKRVSSKDPYFIYSMNDRNMNDQPSYVIKCGRQQLQFLVEMDDGFLCEQTAYGDGTFKRCPGFVTLGLYVYIPVFRKHVKVVTMECEKEDTTNWLIFWSQVNKMLESYTGKKGKVIFL
jgi:hypothetical protein